MSDDIWRRRDDTTGGAKTPDYGTDYGSDFGTIDRKSTRLNSSHT